MQHNTHPDNISTEDYRNEIEWLAEIVLDEHEIRSEEDVHEVVHETVDSHEWHIYVSDETSASDAIACMAYVVMRADLTEAVFDEHDRREAEAMEEMERAESEALARQERRYERHLEERYY